MDYEKMAELIAEQRKRLGMTQKQLAEKLGVTDKAVSKWERGAGCPDISILPALAQALGVTVSELLEGRQDAPPAPESEKIVETTLKYADLSQKAKRGMTRKMVRNIATGAAVLAIVVCAICNFAIQGGLTWALYPIASIVYAWAVAAPLFLLPRRGLAGSLAVATVLTIPFLYVLGILIGNLPDMQAIGTWCAATGLVYLWALYLLFTRMKGRWYTASAWALLLTIPTTFITNFVVDRYVGLDIWDPWDMVRYGGLVLIAAALFIMGGVARRKGNTSIN